MVSSNKKMKPLSYNVDMTIFMLLLFLFALTLVHFLVDGFIGETNTSKTPQTPDSAASGTSPARLYGD